MNIILKIFLIYFLLVFNLAKADEHNSNENWSFYTGTFDFSDDGKKAPYLVYNISILEKIKRVF